MNDKNGQSIPALRYKNAKSAIEWLGKAFGYVEHLVVPGEGDQIAHAQLKLGNGMIMISSSADNEYGRLIKFPAEVDGFNTQSPYVYVEQIDGHYQRAVAAGAEMILDLKEEDYGGKAYTCKDPEGHLWTFGSYNPWL